MVSEPVSYDSRRHDHYEAFRQGSLMPPIMVHQEPLQSLARYAEGHQFLQGEANGDKEPADPRYDLTRAQVSVEKDMSALEPRFVETSGPVASAPNAKVCEGTRLIHCRLRFTALA